MDLPSWLESENVPTATARRRHLSLPGTRSCCSTPAVAMAGRLVVPGWQSRTQIRGLRVCHFLCHLDRENPEIRGYRRRKLKCGFVQEIRAFSRVFVCLGESRSG